MNFAVIVTCAVGVSTAQCPMIGSHSGEMQAASREACVAISQTLIRQMHFDPKAFHIVCKPK